MIVRLIDLMIVLAHSYIVHYHCNSFHALGHYHHGHQEIIRITSLHLSDNPPMCTTYQTINCNIPHKSYEFYSYSFNFFFSDFLRTYTCVLHPCVYQLLAGQTVTWKPICKYMDHIDLLHISVEQSQNAVYAFIKHSRYFH